MTSAEILTDVLSRVEGIVHRALDDIADEALFGQIDDAANTVAWLVWHLTRVQDSHLAEAFGHKEIWNADGFVSLFALPLAPSDTGFGHSPDQVRSVRATAHQLTAYFDAVAARSASTVSALSDTDFDRVVDRSYDPPVTLGLRLASVSSDNLQHAGQAAYVRGVLERTRSSSS